jgi:hypothetical protein
MAVHLNDFDANNRQEQRDSVSGVIAKSRYLAVRCKYLLGDGSSQAEFERHTLGMDKQRGRPGENGRL